jgi:DNA-binding CsgD family transcriptional regulator
MLFGREAECARIDAVLDAARERRSGALLLRGEAGIGKSALLDYAVERAVGFGVLRAFGVESEGEIAFASAQQLLRPVMHALGELPAPQSRALRRAFAIEDGQAPERLAVSVATLSLLAAAAEDRPVLCVVDDAHWLDQASAEVLAFAARRLCAEEVVMLFAAREPEKEFFAAPGVPELRVEALRSDAARALLAARAPDVVGPAAARLVELTQGNPLALLEISRALSRPQLLGRVALDQPLPVRPEIERAFLDRVNALTSEAQRALLLVAAGDPGDADTLWHALAAAELDGDPLAEAEQAGLLLPGGLVFCHPLARSAVYQSVRPADRRAAHAALAAATAEPDRRAWHLSASTDRPNEAVASALEDAASAARRRGGTAAEARALARAADLTAPTELRTRRLLNAAFAAEAAGWFDQAESMLAQVGELTQDAELRAQAVARRSYLLFDRGEFDRAYALAVKEAENAAAGAAASPATSGAIRILWRRLDLPNALAMADRARRAGEGSEPNLDLDTVVAWTWSLAGRVEEARALARASMELTDPGTWLAIDFGTVLLYVEDYPAARDALEQVVERLREAEAPGILSYALDQLAKLETRVGNLTRAYALELESLQLTEPLGNDVGLAASLAWLGLLESMLGRPGGRDHAARALAIAERLHDPWNIVRARGVLGMDALAHGDPAGAVDWLQPAAALAADGGVGHPNYLRLDADLIESLTRLGRRELSEQHLRRLERQAQSTGSPWGRAAAARCRAFLSADGALEEAFETALLLHAHEPSAFEQARTELCFGERLRRAGRRRGAREQLRSALETFELLGARPWAERARVELRATGEHLRARDPTAEEQLTPHELQITLLVAEGLTNHDVAARLFLSPKTVEFHLTRIYRKLEVHSRAELVRRRIADSEHFGRPAAPAGVDLPR